MNTLGSTAQTWKREKKHSRTFIWEFLKIVASSGMVLEVET